MRFAYGYCQRTALIVWKNTSCNDTNVYYDDGMTVPCCGHEAERRRRALVSADTCGIHSDQSSKYSLVPKSFLKGGARHARALRPFRVGRDESYGGLC